MREIQEHRVDYSTAKLGFRTVHFIFDPELARKVLGDPIAFVKTRFVYDKIKPVTGDTGMVQIEGERGLKLRSAFNGFFNREAMEGYLSSVRRVAERELPNLEGVHDVREPLTQLVLQTALSMFVGVESDADATEIAKGFLRLNQLCGQRFQNLLPVPRPVLRWQILRERKALDDALSGLLGGELSKGCLIEKIKSGAQDVPEEVTEAFLRDQVKTFLFAGHETTAAYLTMAVHELAKRPQLQQEIRTEFENSAEGEVGVIARAFMKEVIRFYPPAWMIVRESVNSGELSDQPFRRGDFFFMGVYHMHRHASHWKDPEKFDLENQEEANNSAFMPYGYGKRRCIGAKLADMEVATILEMLLKKFDWIHQSPNEPVEPQIMITAYPKDPVPCGLSPDRTTSIDLSEDD